MRDYKKAKNTKVILHIGLHKTATTFVQNQLSLSRYDLLQENILYPLTGQPEFTGIKTRSGAQSGHGEFTRRFQRNNKLLNTLYQETPANTQSIIISSENFTIWHRNIPPEEYLNRFRHYKSVEVILTLRRQDVWLESYYKQITDGFADRETRTFEEFVQEVGPKLIHFYDRFLPWQKAVGKEHFHVLSYDDMPSAKDLTKYIVKMAGGSDALAQNIANREVERYDSIDALDTLARRIVNTFHLKDPNIRNSMVKELAKISPNLKVNLMTEAVQNSIQEFCAPINKKIEKEWFSEPVPKFTFQEPLSSPQPPVNSDAQALFDFLGLVLSASSNTANKTGQKK